MRVRPSVRLTFQRSPASKVSVRVANDPVRIDSLAPSSSVVSPTATHSSTPATDSGSNRTIRFRARRPTSRRHQVVKVTRRERAANRRARERLSRDLERRLTAILDDFGIRGFDRTRFGQLFRNAANVGMVNNPATGFAVLEAQMGSAISEAMMDAISEGVRIGGNFSGIPGIVIDDQVVQEAALSYLNRPSTQNTIRNIAANQRAGVGQKVADMLTGGISPERAAVEIGDAVGLTRHQARQVENFRRRITGQRIPIQAADTPRVRSTIDRDVRNFTRRLQRNRGFAIAESEMQRAIHAGEQVFWRQAAATGQVDIERLDKTWFTVADDDVCPICEPLHGLTVGFNESFDGLFEAPPAHARCRCFLEMTASETR